MSRGSKLGERRGGRQKGTPNKATAEIKVLAAEHAPAIIKELARPGNKGQERGNARGHRQGIAGSGLPDDIGNWE
jgi:hypothetical protein